MDPVVLPFTELGICGGDDKKLAKPRCFSGGGGNELDC
jgi:hypothetical protein